MELMSIARGVVRATLVLGLVVVGAPAARAQGTGTATECVAGAGAAYQRCALWMDGRKVRRGADGAVVGEPGFFSPLRLTRLVEGDSAIAQAARFERNTAGAGLFGFLSALSFAGALITAEAYDCEPNSFGVCTNDDDVVTTGAIAFLAGGLVSAIVSGVMQTRAARAASRAIFWHNSNFGR